MAEDKKVTLYCTEGGANKQYTLWLEPMAGGWLVQAQYGPVGGWVQSACKTSHPVSRAKAEAMYAKLINEKEAKGYHAGKDAPAFTTTAVVAGEPGKINKDVDSGIRPMLLTPMEEGDIDYYVHSNGWAAQEKLNGKRIMLKAELGKPVVGINKRGLECPIPQELVKAFEGLVGPVVLDGELIGTVYHIFDALQIGREDLRTESLSIRYEKLVRLYTSMWSGLAESPAVKLAELFMGTAAKQALVDRLRRGNREGVVFKKLSSGYRPGRVDDAVKVKFYKAVSVAILGWTDKSSVEVGLREPIKGNKCEVTSVGKVTVPAKYVDQIKKDKGQILRVRYLYATEAGQLYQAHLDPDDAGNVMVSDQIMADPIGDLKYEGKEEE